MAFIPVVPPARATGDTAAAYADLRRVVGADMVAKIVQLFSLRPRPCAG